jgi:hypothetical protein
MNESRCCSPLLPMSTPHSSLLRHDGVHRRAAGGLQLT